MTFQGLLQNESAPGMQFVQVPQAYRDHRLLQDGPYFTLPGPLLTEVIRKVGQDRFDADLLEMDRALSSTCDDHSATIGYWRGQPINYLLLRPNTNFVFDFAVEALTQSGMTAEEARRSLITASDRLNWTSDVSRGYCGWLMTNHEFRNEQLQLFQTWSAQVVENGIPRMGPVVHQAPAAPRAERADGEMGNFLQAFEQFFVRWRLQELAAPFAPVPLNPHFPVLDLRPVLGHMRHGGTTFYIPDIFPVQSRDELREILEKALRNRESPAHLSGWFEIVNSANAARNQIARYARIFEIQHYMRALHARHADALVRKKSVLSTTLAVFLKVSDDTIERDLALISERLGTDWLQVSA